MPREAIVAKSVSTRWTHCCCLRRACRWLLYKHRLPISLHQALSPRQVETVGNFGPVCAVNMEPLQGWHEAMQEVPAHSSKRPRGCVQPARCGASSAPSPLICCSPARSRVVAQRRYATDVPCQASHIVSRMSNTCLSALSSLPGPPTSPN